MSMPVALARDSVTAETHDQMFYPEYPKPNYGTGKTRELIKRGEYLAKIGDCISCHTDSKHDGDVYAGGLAIESPFGTFYTPNITPDKETGIGSWTDKEFINAMKKGKNVKGQHFFPAFPYINFNKMSNDDVLAIKAYLLSIPAVHKANQNHDMPFPFRVRFLQLGWKILFFYPYAGEYHMIQ